MATFYRARNAEWSISDSDKRTRAKTKLGVSAPALPDSARELIPADQIKRAESNASLSLHLIGERTDIIDGAAQDCAF